MIPFYENTKTKQSKILCYQVSPETTLTVMSNKTPQVQEKVGTVVAVTNAATQVTRVVTTGTPVAGRRAMFVLNDPTHTINRVSQQNQTATIQSECKGSHFYYYVLLIFFLSVKYIKYLSMNIMIIY